MKRKLILFTVTVLLLFITGTTIHTASSVDAVSGATVLFKSKSVSLINKSIFNKALVQVQPGLTLADSKFPANLDPAGETNGRFTLQYGVGETLIQLDVNLRPLPWLAESWENIDPLTWKIRLKQGIKFHDGAEMTAQSVKSSLERAVRLNEMAAKLLPISSICMDGFNLTIQTSVPCPALIHSLSDPVFIIVDTSAEDKNEFAYFPICTGPFIPVSFEGRSEVVLQRFENYHGGIPKQSSISIKFISDKEKLAKAIESKEVDGAVDISDENLPLLKTKEYDVRSITTAAAHFLMLNTQNIFLSDSKVRQAITLAINRQAGGSAFSPMLPFEDDIETYPYDPDAARNLLESAGCSDKDGNGVLEKDGKELTLKLAVTGNETELKEQAEALKDQLQTIGIGVDIKTYSGIFFTSRARYGKFDLLLLSAQAGENGDAQSFIESYFSSDGDVNYGRYQNDQVDDSIFALKNEFDINQRISLVNHIQEFVLKDAAFVFLGYPKEIFVAENYVSGLEIYTAYGYRLTADIIVNR